MVRSPLRLRRQPAPYAKRAMAEKSSPRPFCWWQGRRRGAAVRFASGHKLIRLSRGGSCGYLGARKATNSLPIIGQRPEAATLRDAFMPSSFRSALVLAVFLGDAVPPSVACCCPAPE
jgi:hypothetical protein